MVQVSFEGFGQELGKLGASSIVSNLDGSIGREKLTAGVGLET